MAEVPAWYIMEAPIDWDGEIFAASGITLSWGEYHISPPTLGTFSLLEVVDSLLFKDFSKCEVWDIMLAAYISLHGKKCAYDLQQWIRERNKNKTPNYENVSNWHSFERRVIECFSNDINIVTLERATELRAWLDAAFVGYAMLPNNGSGQEGYIFGLDTLGSTIAAVGPELGVSWEELIWNTPMALIGFVIAGKSKINGAKGIARPKDPTDIRIQLDACKERDLTGELHPWQELRPADYPLSKVQQDNPDSVKKYDALMENKK